MYTFKSGKFRFELEELLRDTTTGLIVDISWAVYRPNIDGDDRYYGSVHVWQLPTGSFAVKSASRADPSSWVASDIAPLLSYCDSAFEDKKLARFFHRAEDGADCSGSEEWEV